MNICDNTTNASLFIPDIDDLVFQLDASGVGDAVVGEERQVGQDASAAVAAAAAAANAADPLGPDPVGPDDPNAAVDLVRTKHLAQL